jgi:hypothetical protein
MRRFNIALLLECGERVARAHRDCDCRAVHEVMQSTETSIRIAELSQIPHVRRELAGCLTVEFGLAGGRP